MCIFSRKLLIPIISTILLSINIVSAAQYAHVKSEKAIIYADQELSSPIGFISKGQKIKVGEVPRKYGTLLPVLVSGKVGWIKIKDIQFVELTDSNRETMLEHNIIEFDTTDKLGLNNHIGLNYNTFVLGKEWDELAFAIGDEVGERPTYISLFFEHRPPDLRYSFGLGLGYMFLEQDFLALSAPLFDFKGFWSPIKYKYFNLDLFIGGFLTGAFKLESYYDSIDEEEHDNTGEVFGFKYGIEFKFFPHHTFSIINGISFYSGKVSGISPTKISNESDDTIQFSKFNGTNYYFGLSYQF